MRPLNPEKILIQTSRHTALPLEIAICVIESQKTLANSYNLRMASMLRRSAKYNGIAAINERIRAGRSPIVMLRSFGCPKSIVYYVLTKFNASEESEQGSANRSRETHSRERRSRTAAIAEKAQAAIREGPGQSLRKPT